MKKMKVRYILGLGVIIALIMNPFSIKGECKESIILDKKETQEPKKLKKKYVYTTARVNIRTKDSINGEILLTVEVGTKLQRIKHNVTSEWDTILINDEKYYVSNKYITTKKPKKVAKSIEEQIEENKVSKEDLRYMSAIIYAEAGNQCEAGKQAVGIVVMNRVKSDICSDTVYEVIHEPKQFSPVANGSFAKALTMYDNGELSDEVIEAAKYALRGNTTVYYNNTTYDLDGYLYFSRYVAGCRIQIQNHQFK